MQYLETIADPAFEIFKENFQYGLINLNGKTSSIRP